MVVQSASLVRATAPRSRALSLANTCSIGLRSGEVRRQVDQADTGGPDSVLDAGHFVSGKVVHRNHVAPAAASARGIAARRLQPTLEPFIGLVGSGGVRHQSGATHCPARERRDRATGHTVKQ